MAEPNQEKTRGIQNRIVGHAEVDPKSLTTNPQAVEVFRFGEFAGWVVERSE